MTLYLNNFRIALPVAFPATRRPTRLPTLPFFRAHLLGAPRRLLGLAIKQRGGRRPGGIAGQTLGMGRRILLWQRGTQPGTVDGDFWNIRVR